MKISSRFLFITCLIVYSRLLIVIGTLSLTLLCIASCRDDSRDNTFRRHCNFVAHRYTELLLTIPSSEINLKSVNSPSDIVLKYESFNGLEIDSEHKKILLLNQIYVSVKWISDTNLIIFCNQPCNLYDTNIAHGNMLSLEFDYPKYERVENYRLVQQK